MSKAHWRLVFGLSRSFDGAGIHCCVHQAGCCAHVCGPLLALPARARQPGCCNSKTCCLSLLRMKCFCSCFTTCKARKDHMQRNGQQKWFVLRSFDNRFAAVQGGQGMTACSARSVPAPTGGALLPTTRSNRMASCRTPGRSLAGLPRAVLVSSVCLELQGLVACVLAAKGRVEASCQSVLGTQA